MGEATLPAALRQSVRSRVKSKAYYERTSRFFRDSIGKLSHILTTVS